MRGAQLRGLLEKMEPFDDREEGFRVQMLTLLAGSGDPFDRAHFVPGHFTASSFVLSPDGQKLLLIFHGKLSRWLQPGGHVDPSDLTIVEAARREVSEEVGLEGLEQVLEGIFDIDVHLIPAMKGEPAHEHHDIRFLFRARQLEFVVGSDAKDARWVAFSEVTEMESDRSVMRAVEKLQVRVRQDLIEPKER